MFYVAAATLSVAACGGQPPPPPLEAHEPAPTPGPSPSPQPAPQPAPTPAPAPAPASPPAGPSFAGCPVFPPDNAYNTDISQAPVDPDSDAYLKFMGAGTLFLHPDFGAPEYGLPFAVVDATQPLVPISILYAVGSDPGPYPFPLDLHVQGDGLYAGGDRHAIVFDAGACKLYESWNTNRDGDGFAVGSGAIFDLTSGASRGPGRTSADAAGLPIFPGLARFDEAVVQGAVNHALAFGATGSAHAWVDPATHSSGTSDDPWAPPLGARLRLKRGFDLTPYHGTSLVLLLALQRYGMFLVDNQDEPFWSLGGVQDPRWDDVDLQQLKSVPASAFELVQLGARQAGP